MPLPKSHLFPIVVLVVGWISVVGSLLSSLIFLFMLLNPSLLVGYNSVFLYLFIMSLAGLISGLGLIKHENWGAILFLVCVYLGPLHVLLMPSDFKKGIFEILGVTTTFVMPYLSLTLFSIIAFLYWRSMKEISVQSNVRE